MNIGCTCAHGRVCIGTHKKAGLGVLMGGMPMSCRFDPLADTTFSCVGDMTKDMSLTRHAMSANEGLGRHDR